MTETTTDTRTMTPERLAEIETRTNAAPKGPWVIEGDYPQRVTNAEALVIAECFEGPQWPPSIAEFIAHAREDVPALLAEVERQQAKLNQPCGSCHPCSNYADETWREADRKPPHVYQWDGLRDDLAEIERLAYMGGQDAETIRRAILGVFAKRSRS